MKLRPVAGAGDPGTEKRPFYESMSIALSALHHNWGEIIFEVAFLLSFTCWDANSLVIFIPRGFVELGISNLPFGIPWVFEEYLFHLIKQSLVINIIHLRD